MRLGFATLWQDLQHLCPWLRTMANRTRRIGSICTGAAILIAAGPAKGRRVTTHWSAIEDLRAKNQAIVLV